MYWPFYEAKGRVPQKRVCIVPLRGQHNVTLRIAPCARPKAELLSTRPKDEEPVSLQANGVWGQNTQLHTQWHYDSQLRIIIVNFT